jgi:hypothetical protein
MMYADVTAAAWAAFRPQTRGINYTRYI